MISAAGSHGYWSKHLATGTDWQLFPFRPPNEQVAGTKGLDFFASSHNIMRNESPFSTLTLAMNPNESEQLTRFLNQLRDARVNGRDTEADRMIRAAVHDNPDAAYLLVQRAMLMEQALNNAKAQISQLKQQVDYNRQEDRDGFLGRGNPWAAGIEPTRAQTRVPGSAGYQVPQGSTPGGGSSFLGNIATTAAGVVAGSFLFQGIENLLGHHAASSGFASATEPVAGDTTINNYYGDDAAETWAEQDNADPFLAEDDRPDSFGDDTFLDGPDDSSWV